MAQKKSKKNHKISDHFSKRDFVCKCGNCESSVKISLGLIGGLELLRSKTRNRINIVKGFVCQDAAEKSGQVKRNHHTLGIAAEITVDNMKPKDVFLLAEEVPEFMGIGLDLTHNVLHVDTRKGKDRTLWVIEEGRQLELDSQVRQRLFPAQESQPIVESADAGASRA